jgi:hypothetical protein
VAISGHLLILLQQSVVISGNQRPPAHPPPAISGHQWQSAATCSFSSSNQWSSVAISGHLLILLQQHRGTKVDKLDGRVGVLGHEHDVLGLDIAVHDAA